MSEETQKTIHAWSTQTFGLCTDKSAVVQRMMQEVDELDFSSRHLQVPAAMNNFDVSVGIIADECADVLIMLYQVASTYGFDLHTQVDHKMAINRKRNWALNGDGTAQHIP